MKMNPDSVLGGAVTIRRGPSTVSAHPAAAHPHPTDLPRGAEGAVTRSPYLSGTAMSRTQGFTSRTSSTGVSGTAYIPVLLTQFPDRAADAAAHTPGAFDNLLFEKGSALGAGSLRDYYLAMSGGRFDVTGTVTQKWLDMPQSYSTYAGDKNGYQWNEPNDFTLVKDAVDAADAAIDFCRADTNEDGLVDTLFVVHAGPGAEETGNGIWSIHWYLAESYATDDVCANGRAVRVKDFTIVPEEYKSDRYASADAPANMVSIGVFAHEFAHVLGLPDLYDTDYSTVGGVGPWDLMASGTYGFNGRQPWRPMPLSAWSLAYLGWAKPANVSDDLRAGDLASLDVLGRNQGEAGIYRIAPGGSATADKYFLVENRNPKGWSAGMPEAGVLIWKVDETVATNDDDNARMVKLIQADGLDELHTSGDQYEAGDAGDLWPGSTNNRLFGPSTKPSSNLGDVDSAVTIRIRSIGTLSSLDLLIFGQDTEPEPPPPSSSSSPTPTPSPTQTAATTGTATDRVAPLVTEVKAGPSPFTPNGDGERDFLRIRFALDEESRVDVDILGRSGTVMKQLLHQKVTPAGEVRVRWNGRTMAGKIARGGRYTYRISAIDAVGNVAPGISGVVKLVR